MSKRVAIGIFWVAWKPPWPFLFNFGAALATQEDLRHVSVVWALHGNQYGPRLAQSSPPLAYTCPKEAQICPYSSYTGPPWLQIRPHTRPYSPPTRPHTHTRPYWPSGTGLSWPGLAWAELVVAPGLAWADLVVARAGLAWPELAWAGLRRGFRGKGKRGAGLQPPIF